jgi:hypothetical protein
MKKTTKEAVDVARALIPKSNLALANPNYWFPAPAIRECLKRKNLPNQWCAGWEKVDSLAIVFASQPLAREILGLGHPIPRYY